MRNLKRILTAIVFVWLTILPVAAYDFAVDGLFFNADLDNMTCTLVKGEKAYSGDIIIPEFVNVQGRTFTVNGIDGAFEDCSGLSSITIPSSITIISDNSFRNCAKLTEIVIPTNVTTLGNSCFSGCKGLTKISLPENATSLGNSCFSGCTGLTNITIPERVTCLGNSCFSDCTGLKNITISGCVTSLGKSCFSGCTRLTNINIPQSVIDLGESCFFNCISLSAIELKNGIQKIPKQCFMDCFSLASINIPASVDEIGDDSFKGCTSLKSLFLEDSQKTLEIGYKEVRELKNGHIYVHQLPLFEDCPLVSLYLGRNLTSRYSSSPDITPFRNQTRLSQVIISKSVTSIGRYLFYGCSNLTEVVIPNSVTSISDAFVNSGLQSIVIEDGVEELYGLLGSKLKYIYLGRNIKREASWQNLKMLNKLVIGDFVYNIDALLKNDEQNASSLAHYADLGTIQIGASLKDVPDLSAISTLDTIMCTSLTPPNVTSFSNAQYINTNVIVPNGSSDAYKQASGWNKFWNITEDDIQPKVFMIEGVRYLITSDFEVCVMPLPQEAYSGDIKIPETVHFNKKDYKVTNLGQAFKDCEDLTSVSLPASVNTIERYAFSGCKKLYSVTTAGKIVRIGEYAFSDCEILTQLPITSGLIEVGNHAFEKCQSIETVKLPDGILQLGELAFSECKNLASVVIGDGIAKLEDGTFKSCEKLAEISLPSTLTTICADVFNGCIALEEVNLPERLIELQDYSFRQATNLKSLQIPSSVARIGMEAFSGCNNLSELVIADSRTPLQLGRYINSFDYYGPEKDSQDNEVIYRYIKYYHGCFWGCPIESLYIGRDLVYDHYDRTYGSYNGRTAIYDNKYDSPFYGNSSLRFVTIGNQVSQIGEETINISDWGKTVSPDLFKKCTNIERVESWNIKAPKWVMFENKVYQNALLYVEEGALPSYSITDGWKEFSNMHEDNHNFISKQPTEEDLSIELDSPDENAIYTWYRHEFFAESTIDITNDMVSTGEYPWSYSEAEGWESSNHSINSSSSIMEQEIEVTDSIVLTFDWKVSSEPGYDKLKVYWNDNLIFDKSGVDSGKYSYYFTKARKGKLKFEYSKDDGDNLNEDRVWINNVKLSKPRRERTSVIADENSPRINNLNNCQIGNEIWCVVQLSNGLTLTSDKVLITQQTGIEQHKMDSQEEIVAVYNLQGILIQRGKMADVFKTLSQGIYIVNGKKVLVR